MFGYALRHPKVPAKNGIQNHAGLTPLTLACKLGRASVFREMLELSAIEFWRYSNITCSAYPLNALDTLLPNGRTSIISTKNDLLKNTTENVMPKSSYRLEFRIIHNFKWNKRRTFGHVRWWHHTTTFGRKMENFCQSKRLAASYLAKF